jgi:hypothetical protein
VDGAVGVGEHPRNSRSVVEIDYHRFGASVTNFLRLFVVANERGHLVAVRDEVAQHV